MTDNELVIIRKYYEKFSAAITQQEKFYLDHNEEAPCKITLDLFFRAKRYPIDIINFSFSKLGHGNGDYENCCKISDHLDELYKTLKAERSATRVERRKSALCAKYDKLVISSINETASMITRFERYKKTTRTPHIK